MQHLNPIFKEKSTLREEKKKKKTDDDNEGDINNLSLKIKKAKKKKKITMWKKDCNKGLVSDFSLSK